MCFAEKRIIKVWRLSSDEGNIEMIWSDLLQLFFFFSLSCRPLYISSSLPSLIPSIFLFLLFFISFLVINLISCFRSPFLSFSLHFLSVFCSLSFLSLYFVICLSLHLSSSYPVDALHLSPQRYSHLSWCFICLFSIFLICFLSLYLSFPSFFLLSYLFTSHYFSLLSALVPSSSPSPPPVSSNTPLPIYFLIYLLPSVRFFSSSFPFAHPPFCFTSSEPPLLLSSSEFFPSACFLHPATCQLASLLACYLCVCILTGFTWLGQLASG